MPAAECINRWLYGDGRLLGNAADIVAGYAERLLGAGIPVSRIRVGQQLANPMIAAWGVIWTPQGVQVYDVPRSALDTDTWQGSPFQNVIESRKPLRKRLVGLDTQHDHHIYLELAAEGGTDYFALPLVYGDGSAQGCSFVSNSSSGFHQEHLELIESTCSALASAMEPLAMRRTTESLLTTYLGKGPARAVINGTILRGEHEALEAVIMFSDLRGFTQKSADWPESDLLEALDEVFGVVVDAVHTHAGEVLKFIGDGVLAIFPVKAERSAASRCRDAVRVAHDILSSMRVLNSERRSKQKEELDIGIGIDLGRVTYGNIGSPNRLDFTVLGSAVNVASRIQDKCKILEEPVLASHTVAKHVPSALASRGVHALHGVKASLELYRLKPEYDPSQKS